MSASDEWTYGGPQRLIGRDEYQRGREWDRRFFEGVHTSDPRDHTPPWPRHVRLIHPAARRGAEPLEWARMVHPHGGTGFGMRGHELGYQVLCSRVDLVRNPKGGVDSVSVNRALEQFIDLIDQEAGRAPANYGWTHPVWLEELQYSVERPIDAMGVHPLDTLTMRMDALLRIDPQDAARQREEQLRFRQMLGRYGPLAREAPSVSSPDPSSDEAAVMAARQRRSEARRASRGSMPSVQDGPKALGPGESR